MTRIERQIVRTYSGLLNGLSAAAKKMLIKNLEDSSSIKEDETNRAFFNSFGAFDGGKPAEKIVSEIRMSRKFRKREIRF